MRGDSASKAASLLRRRRTLVDCPDLTAGTPAGDDTTAAPAAIAAHAMHDDLPEPGAEQTCETERRGVDSRSTHETAVGVGVCDEEGEASVPAPGEARVGRSWPDDGVTLAVKRVKLLVGAAPLG